MASTPSEAPLLTDSVIQEAERRGAEYWNRFPWATANDTPTPRRERERSRSVLLLAWNRLSNLFGWLMTVDLKYFVPLTLLILLPAAFVLSAFYDLSPVSDLTSNGSPTPLVMSPRQQKLQWIRQNKLKPLLNLDNYFPIAGHSNRTQPHFRSYTERMAQLYRMIFEELDVIYNLESIYLGSVCGEVNDELGLNLKGAKYFSISMGDIKSLCHALAKVEDTLILGINRDILNHNAATTKSRALVTDLINFDRLRHNTTWDECPQKFDLLRAELSEISKKAVSVVNSLTGMQSVGAPKISTVLDDMAVHPWIKALAMSNFTVYQPTVQVDLIAYNNTVSARQGAVNDYMHTLNDTMAQMEAASDVFNKLKNWVNSYETNERMKMSENLDALEDERPIAKFEHCSKVFAVVRMGIRRWVVLANNTKSLIEQTQRSKPSVTGSVSAQTSPNELKTSDTISELWTNSATEIAESETIAGAEEDKPLETIVATLASNARPYIPLDKLTKLGISDAEQMREWIRDHCMKEAHGRKWTAEWVENATNGFVRCGYGGENGGREETAPWKYVILAFIFIGVVWLRGNLLWVPPF